MKKEYFILIFVLVSLGFMYAPLEKVSSVAQGFCFSGENSNLVSLGELPKEVSANLNYGNLLTSWKARAENSGIVLLNKNINSQGIYQQEISGMKSGSSTEKCEFWTFSVQRNSGVLNLNLPLDHEETDPDGRKNCYYKLSDQIVGEIASLGGGAVSSMSDVCPELVNGRVQESGDECALTAECSVNIRGGEPETFALGVEKDYCGKEFVYELNNANKILDSELDAKAQEFVSQCENGRSPATKAPFVTIDPGISGGRQGQPAGVSCCSHAPPECSDGIDNDGDGMIDYQMDLDCDFDPNGDSEDGCGGGFVLFGKSIIGGKSKEECKKIDACFSKAFGKSPNWAVLDWVGRKVSSLGSIKFKVRKYGKWWLWSGAGTQSTEIKRWVDEDGYLIGETVIKIEFLEGSAGGGDVAAAVAEIARRKLKGCLSSNDVNETFNGIKDNYNKQGRTMVTRIDEKTGNLIVLIKDESSSTVFFKTYNLRCGKSEILKLILEGQDIIGINGKEPGDGLPDMLDDILFCTDSTRDITLTIVDVDGRPIGQVAQSSSEQCSTGNNAISNLFNLHIKKYFDDMKNKLKNFLNCLGSDTSALNF